MHSIIPLTGPHAARPGVATPVDGRGTPGTGESPAGPPLEDAMSMIHQFKIHENPNGDVLLMQDENPDEYPSVIILCREQIPLVIEMLQAVMAKPKGRK